MPELFRRHMELVFGGFGATGLLPHHLAHVTFGEMEAMRAMAAVVAERTADKKPGPALTAKEEKAAFAGALAELRPEYTAEQLEAAWKAHQAERRGK